MKLKKSISQTNGCCFDPVVVEQLITFGAAQAWQQLTAFQGELSIKFEVQRQPMPATPVHTHTHTLEGGERADENMEEQRRRAASRQNGYPAPGGRNEGFPAGPAFDSSKLPRSTGEGHGDEFNSRRGGRKSQTNSEGERCRSEQVPFSNSQSRDPNTSEENRPGRGPSIPSPGDQGGMKQETCIPEDCCPEEGKKGVGRGAGRKADTWK